MNTKLTQQQLQALGMDTLTVQQREDFLLKVGKSVFNEAIVKLISSFSQEQLYALNYAIESNESFESVIEYLQKTYPGFDTYIQDAQEEFVGQFIAQLKQPA